MYNPYYYPPSTSYQYNQTPYYYVSQPQYVIHDPNLDVSKGRLRTNIDNNIQDYSSYDQRGRAYVLPEKQKPAASQERNRKTLVDVSAVVKTEPSFHNTPAQLKTGQKATILQSNTKPKEETLKVELQNKIGRIEVQNFSEKGRTTDKKVEDKKNTNIVSGIQVQSANKNEIKVNTEATNSNQVKNDALKRVAPTPANIKKKSESCFLIQIPCEGHFEGITKQNKKNGYGVFRDLKENEIYNGEWLEDDFHGMGILKNDKAQHFNGLYDFKKLVNIGLQWKDYEGEFKKGKPHGLGTLTLSNGEKFNGLWEDGNINGEGFFEDNNGKIKIVGRWEKGLMVKVL